jgi:arylsulfatase A-like enzyme
MIPGRNRLNVVMIVADQVSARAMRYGGNSQVKTPHIDTLVNRGLGFNKAICQAPICMPSRASFNTGLYPHTVCVNENPYVLDRRFSTLAEYMKDAGYITGGFGHLGGDGLERGYDIKCDMIDPPLSTAWAKEQLAVTGDGGKDHSYTGILPFHESESFDDIVTELSKDFINKNAGNEQAFFMQTNFYKPHTPWIIPQKYVDMYNSEELELPLSWNGDDMDNKHPFMTDNIKAIGMDRISEDERKKSLMYYYAAISYIDDKVGRIIKTLEDNGMLDNTMIIFTSDHGDFGLEHGTAGKMGAFYNCLVNVPLIIFHPGNEYRHNETDNSLVELVDLMPTILDICDIKVKQTFPGFSRKDLLTGMGNRRKKKAFSQVINSNSNQIDEWKRGDVPLRPLIQDPFSAGPLGFLMSGAMIIKEEYKLIYYQDGTTELYNIDTDPDEIVNLSNKKEYNEIIFELIKDLFSWELRHIAMGEFQSPLPYHYKASAKHHIPDNYKEEKEEWDRM